MEKELAPCDVHPRRGRGLWLVMNVENSDHLGTEIQH
jgi:hypothetical protein